MEACIQAGRQTGKGYVPVHARVHAVLMTMAMLTVLVMLVLVFMLVSMLCIWAPTLEGLHMELKGQSALHLTRPLELFPARLTQCLVQGLLRLCRACLRTS